MSKSLAYGFWSLVGACLLLAMASPVARRAGRIAALARLPRASADGTAVSAAIFGGVLEGPVRATPLGTTTTAWLGVVNVTGRGKGHHTWEACRLGSLDELALRLSGAAGARLAIAAPSVSSIDFDDTPGLVWGPDEATHVRFKRSTKLSPVPPAVVQQCGLRRANVDGQDWTYEEQWAERGEHVEVAGCRAGDSVVACHTPEGTVIPAHLAVDGIRALARRFADRFIAFTTLLGAACSVFAAVMGFGAVKVARDTRGRAPNP